MFIILDNLNVTHVTPHEVMSAITRIYQTFDQRSEFYPTIARLRIFTDTYFCASGLFSDDESKATEELADFAQNCLDILEDLNVKLYSQYSLRAGLHAGGPILAGRVGEGKAVFDVFGKAVGFARLLAVSAPENTVQMSEAAYGRLNPAHYPSKRRNLVIHGVERLTYVVRSAGSSSVPGTPARH